MLSMANFPVDLSVSRARARTREEGESGSQETHRRRATNAKPHYKSALNPAFGTGIILHFCSFSHILAPTKPSLLTFLTEMSTLGGPAPREQPTVKRRIFRVSASRKGKTNSETGGGPEEESPCI